jgi:hypothetical protein
MLWAWLLPFHEAAFVSLLLTKAYVLNPMWKQPFIIKLLRTLFSSLEVLFNLMSRHLSRTLRNRPILARFRLRVLLDTRNKISCWVPRINWPALLAFLPNCSWHMGVIKCWRCGSEHYRTTSSKKSSITKTGIQEISKGSREIKREGRTEEPHTHGLGEVTRVSCFYSEKFRCQIIGELLRSVMGCKLHRDGSLKAHDVEFHIISLA